MCSSDMILKGAIEPCRRVELLSRGAILLVTQYACSQFMVILAVVVLKSCGAAGSRPCHIRSISSDPSRSCIVVPL